ncbi:MAG: Rne/Rng family ribonuclease [Fusobacteriaceae bacterium]|nr:Rne/Rng family ribonuclease [Fusobacteriaceae bacterium]
MKQIIINVNEIEIQIAFLEDNRVVEFFTNRDDKERINGNIIKGKVENILPGMESAFVNIGKNKNSFLYVNDLREFEEKFLDGIKNSDKPIEEILKVGDEVVVQVIKEPRGSKGARVTTHYTIPGKYLVLMPNNDYVGVSKKIKDEEERERLIRIVKDIKPEKVGVIIRTDALGKDEIYFEREIEYLIKKWEEIERKMNKIPVGEVLYNDNNLIRRVVRDIFNHDVDELIINDENSYWDIIDYIAAFSDSSLNLKVKLYAKEKCIFEEYNVWRELNQALNTTVWLKCGGYLVIEKTEALISIDVNTGKNIGIHNLEETVLQTNLDAAKEIAIQLRLRNLSGIIIIDFIDMKFEEDKELLIKTLGEALEKDRIKNNIVHFTDLGLIEMTRKRVGNPLSNDFLEVCKECGGLGHVKSKTTLLSNIFKEIKLAVEDKDIRKLLLYLSEDLHLFIMENYSDFIKSYVKEKNKNILFFKDDTRKNQDFELILEV